MKSVKMEVSQFCSHFGHLFLPIVQEIRIDVLDQMFSIGRKCFFFQNVFFIIWLIFDIFPIVAL